jgi:BirA family biotin operon repressor/biotin-[acetyl-CoA-carboxylase] ligase
MDDLANFTTEHAARLPSRFGRAHRHFADLDSTNDEGMRWLASAGRGRAPAGAVITADAQTRGRGRQGRVWSSPPGEDLYASVVTWWRADGPSLAPIGLVVGLAIRDAIAELVSPWGALVQVKWPNDVLVDGRKIAGILCEARWQDREVGLVIGFGINVARTDFPPELEAKATSFARVADARGLGVSATAGSVDVPRSEGSSSPAFALPSRGEVLLRVLRRLEAELDGFATQGFHAARARYAAACETLGRVVELHVAGEGGVVAPLRAFATGLDADGALRIRDVDDSGDPPRPTGSERRIDNADVGFAP